MKAELYQIPFTFVRDAVTSRNVLTCKNHFFLKIDNGLRNGWGECAPIMGLTPESEPEIVNELKDLCAHINSENSSQFVFRCSAVQMAFEMAMAMISSREKGKYFGCNDHFCLSVNGLVWMNSKEEMLDDALALISQGFAVIKLKVDFKKMDDISWVLSQLRSQHNADTLKIRLDANGSFPGNKAVSSLNELSVFEIDSLEQPIAVGSWKEMSHICKVSPIRIALDEELIMMEDPKLRTRLLQEVNPSFLVLKPSLHGGLASCEDWIERCAQQGVGWWCTSYLESNLGLAALAQWLSLRDNGQTHGLGTGKLYHQNFNIPARVESGKLEWNGCFSPSLESFPDITKLC